MNQMQFKELCEETARALQAEMFPEEDGRCALLIDGIDVLVDLDEEADMLYCYVDLGDPSPHDRTQVCEQLLALNLNTHSNHNGAYAFEADAGRAIFCANLSDAATLTGDEFGETLRYYMDETELARQMIANPVMHGARGAESIGAIFTGALA